MRVLWISPNGGNYKDGKVSGTGGWIGALQDKFTEYEPDLELGIAFGSSDSDPLKDGNVTYFPIKLHDKKIAGDLLNRLFQKEVDLEKKCIANLKHIIKSFKPDIIHVWGIENTYAAVIPYLNCPFVVHIQGLLSLYLSLYMPPAVSLQDISRVDSWCRPKTWIKKVFHCTQKDIYNFACYRAERELMVSKYIKNWMGRTNWDYNAAQLLSPGSMYYHCDEIMRGEFNDALWRYHYDGQTIVIHSSLSSEWYKGIDVVLKTAALLKDFGIKIQWNVFGVSYDDSKVCFFSRKFHINPNDVNVYFHGRVEGGIIKDSLSKSDVFVHPSYIENSSNAIAEAMIMGVPTIAQYVGGNPSMLLDNSGILVAPGEPYVMASAILQMRDKEIAEGYSIRAMSVARERQNSRTIVNNLIDIYEKIIKSSN